MKIAFENWYATLRRTEKDRPSRIRSTSYVIGSDGSPGRTKYACNECTRRDGSTVRPAATRAWPATCPPIDPLRPDRRAHPLEAVLIELTEVEQPHERVDGSLRSVGIGHDKEPS